MDKWGSTVLIIVHYTIHMHLTLPIPFLDLDLIRPGAEPIKDKQFTALAIHVALMQQHIHVPLIKFIILDWNNIICMHV